jgi:hypothetical protein
VKVVAAACLYFLRLLEEWFEQIQQLTHGITREELPESARAVVSQLQTAILSRAEAPSLTHPLRQGQAWLRR